MLDKLTGLKAVDEMLTKAFRQTAMLRIQLKQAGNCNFLSGMKKSLFFVYDEICNTCIKNT
jgi:hypothetical protein